MADQRIGFLSPDGVRFVSTSAAVSVYIVSGIDAQLDPCPLETVLPPDVRTFGVRVSMKRNLCEFARREIKAAA